MMKEIYVKTLILNCHATLVSGDVNSTLDSFSIDTRTLQIGDVFVGIKGEKFDGGTLYKEALEKGAKGCIINDNLKIDKEILIKYPDSFVVQVPNTLECLQSLACIKRNMYDIPVIAITGSVGKTSTKDLVASVLSQKFNVLKTEGNFNNHLGLPLTILKLKDHDSLVVEMGMNNLGEISKLSKIAKPTLGIITNVGTAHIGILGSRENILKAKLEILDGMENKNLIINNDNDLLSKWYIEHKNDFNLITYGINNDANYNAYDINSTASNSTYHINIQNSEYEIKVPTPGEHFILNSLAALSVGLYFNIPIEKIKDGILNYQLSSRRMDILNINGITIINDCYNANLDSMVSAINYLGSLEKRKIAVVGDMLELGSFSEKLHRELGSVICNNKIDILITVGHNAKYISDECEKLGFNKNNLFAYDSNKEAIDKLKSIMNTNDAILIKASNGMHFMEIYNALKEE